MQEVPGESRRKQQREAGESSRRKQEQTIGEISRRKYCSSVQYRDMTKD
jgi:hypothetical protein